MPPISGLPSVVPETGITPVVPPQSRYRQTWHSDPAAEVRCATKPGDPRGRVEPHGSVEVLDRHVGIARVKPQGAARVSSRCQVRVEGEGAIGQNETRLGANSPSSSKARWNRFSASSTLPLLSR